MTKIFELVRYILISVLIIQVFIPKFLDAGRSITRNTNRNKAIIKTIKVENGGIIDCFDIYKQPAFDHPSLRNHTLQMKPSSYPKGMKADNFKFKLKQIMLQEKEKCPKGTIPIRRARKHNYNLTVPQFLGNLGEMHPDREVATHGQLEYAIVQEIGDGKRYYGAKAKLNVWKPTLESHAEYSASQIWVEAYDPTFNIHLNSIQAGWMVNPSLYDDDEPHFFINWINIESKRGCFNLLCPGFVQTDTQFDFGTVIKPVSTFNASQYVVSVVIFRNEDSYDWWVRLQDRVVGYYPGTIFTSLTAGATQIRMGGLILNSKILGPHTKTQMGSGEFPSLGFGRASFFGEIGIIDAGHTMRDPENLQKFTTNWKCYDVQIGDFGHSFFYGGPGFTDNYCPLSYGTSFNF